MIGKRFGHLVVIDESESKRYSNGEKVRMWLCRCDCGTEKAINQAHLISGNSTSCGCKKVRHVADLTGRRFGRLVVQKFAGIRIVGKGQRKSQWECLCDCGNTIIATGNNLQSGYVLSCGCYKAEVTRNRCLKPLEGKRFGKLTVLSRVENDRRNRIQYLCSCDCGGSTIVTADLLRRGGTTSCGCIKSRGESLINRWLVDHNIRFKTQYTSDDMVFKSGYRPIFDFAIFDSNDNIICLIEYNGIQHYSTGYGWNDEAHFIETKNRDMEKMRQCGKSGYSLAIIPYSMIDHIDEAMMNINKVFRMCS